MAQFIQVLVMPQPLFILMFAVYALLRVTPFWGIREVAFPDTQDYFRVATMPILDASFWAGERPFTFPLLVKMLGGHHVLITWVMLGFSIACWGALAWHVARQMQRRWLQIAAFAMILAFSLAAEVSQWDRVLLSESLSLSLLALFVLFSMRLLDVWHARDAVFLSVVAFFWALTRDTNAYFLLMIGVTWGVLVLVRVLSARFLAPAAVLIAILVFDDWSANNGKRWVVPFLNSLSQRVLVSVERTEFFENRGMPITNALMRRAGGWASSEDLDYFTNPALDEFRQWMYAAGKKTYVQFLLSDLRMFFGDPVKHWPELISPDLGEYGPAGFQAPLPKVLARTLYPKNIGILTLWLLTAFGLAGYAAHRRRLRTEWIAPGALVVLAAPLALLVFNADAMEVPRHSLQVGIQLRLGLLIVCLLGVSAMTYPASKGER